MSQASSGTKRSLEGGSSSGSKKQRGENLTLRFLLQSKHAGGIIGKGGQTIKRLRSEYNATVSVPDSNTNERVLSISASQDNAIKVWKECLPLFHEPPYPNSSNQDKQIQHEINYLIHSSLAGSIIGRGGSKIKELQEQTMATIKILSDCLPSSTERVIILGGNEESITYALCKILDLVQDVPPKGFIAFYDPNQDGWNESGFNDYGGPQGLRGSSMRGGRGGMRGGKNFGGFGPNNSGYGGRNDYGGNFGGDYGNGNFGSFNDSSLMGSGESQTNQVTIPNDLAGAIIGKGGERIRNIRQRSGADIKIDDPLPGKADRVITICGNSGQIEYAQFLMQQSVRQHSHKK